MEIWDAYREDGSLAGCDLIRGERIPEGLCHLVCEILVQHTDGDYLLMQRDFSKDMFPGMFEATAGGSALKGESPLEGALRELKEETGITADELIFIYCVLNEKKDSIYYGYLCVTDCDKSSVTLQEGETVGYMWLPKDKFLEFWDNQYQLNRDRLNIYLDTIR